MFDKAVFTIIVALVLAMITVGVLDKRAHSDAASGLQLTKIGGR